MSLFQASSDTKSKRTEHPRLSQNLMRCAERRNFGPLSHDPALRTRRRQSPEKVLSAVRRIISLVPTVLSPFPCISDHVVKTKGICFEASHRICIDVTIVALKSDNIGKSLQRSFVGAVCIFAGLFCARSPISGLSAPAFPRCKFPF